MFDKIGSSHRLSLQAYTLFTNDPILSLNVPLKYFTGGADIFGVIEKASTYLLPNMLIHILVDPDWPHPDVFKKNGGLPGGRSQFI